jgi:hypothetical protein
MLTNELHHPSTSIFNSFLPLTITHLLEILRQVTELCPEQDIKSSVPVEVVDGGSWCL